MDGLETTIIGLTTDYVDAQNFAAAQVKRLKCLDNNIKNKTCTIDGENDCYTWKNNDSIKTWTTPDIKTSNECGSNSDCPFSLVCDTNNKTCYMDHMAYINQNFHDVPAPSGNGFGGAGNCKITGEKTCMQKSIFPYDKTKNKERTYVEYVEDPTSYKKGKCKPKTCNPDSDDNCELRCTPVGCLTDNDCKEDTTDTALIGTTGKCNPANNHCHPSNDLCTVDKGEEGWVDACSEKSSCPNTGVFKLTESQQSCYGNSPVKNDDGSDKYDAEELGYACDKDVTDGTCYDTGACPNKYMDPNSPEVYLEWHTSGQCTKDPTSNPEKQVYTCEAGARSVCSGGGDDVGNCTCVDENDCAGNSTCSEDKICTPGGKCVYANHLWRQFAEAPQCRPGAESNDDKVALNHWNTHPPFAYDQKTGNAYVTHKYCWYGNMEFGRADTSKSKVCNGIPTTGNDSDECKSWTSSPEKCVQNGCDFGWDPQETIVPDETKCNPSDSYQGQFNDYVNGEDAMYPNGAYFKNNVNDTCRTIKSDWWCAKEYDSFSHETGDWRCTGPGAQCKLETGWDKFWEATLGSTLYNGFFGTGFGKCGGISDFDATRNFDESFKLKENIPQKTKETILTVRKGVNELINSTDDVYALVESKKHEHSILLKNYATEIDLYAVKPSDLKATIGLDEEQVRKILPDLKYVTKNKLKYVVLTRADANINPTISKLYGLFSSKII